MNGNPNPIVLMTSTDQSKTARPTKAELFKVSLKVGLLSFGGPAAQISVMHQEFVESRKWVSEDTFLHALNYCMLLPGPEAQQLATYCGWLCGRTLGGLIAGLLFILPGALAMALVSYLYAAYGDFPVLAAVFYGIKAGVLAIVLQALIRIGRKALTSRLSWAICATSFAALFLFSIPFPLIILCAAAVGLLFGTRRNDDAAGKPVDPSQTASLLKSASGAAIGFIVWGAPPFLAALLLAPGHVLVDIAEFFSLLAVVSFGGAYALLSFMAQVAIETKDWISPGEMLDGLGLAETTPGPLILVTQFVGFLAGWRNPEPMSALQMGLFAAAMTTWVTFTPSFLFVLIGAPWMERLRGNRRLNHALSAITAAVAGTILNLAVWFSANVLFGTVRTIEFGPFRTIRPELISVDLTLTAIALIAVGLVFWANRGVAQVVGASAVLGVAASFLV